jgi:hypothetical protein
MNDQFARCCTLRIKYVILLLIAGLSVAGIQAGCGKGSNMNSLAEVKKTAIQSVGTEYISARNTLISSSDYDASGDSAHVSWQESWIARIVSIRRMEPALTDTIYQYLQGHLGYASKKITGQFTAEECARAIVQKGAKAIPVLIELVWKLQDAPENSLAVSAAFSALYLFNDDKTLPVFRDLAKSCRLIDYRHSAISGLGFLKDSASAGLISSILLNRSEEEQIRIAALDSYARLDLVDVFDKASAILKDSKEPVDLRVCAATILTERKEPEITSLFESIIMRDDTVQVLITVADGIRYHNNEKSIPLLKELKKKNHDSTLEVVIDEAIESIEAASQK